MKHFSLFLLFFLLIISTACSGAGTSTPVLPGSPQTSATAPIPTGTPVSYLQRANPIGVALLQEEGNQLAFHDLAGTLLGTRPLTNPETTVDTFHVYGSASAGTEALGVLHIASGSDKVTVSTEDRLIVSLDGILTGYSAIPGQPVLALATAQDTADGNLLWQIHLVTTATMPEDEALLSMVMPYGGAITPLHIVVQDGEPVAIWYTRLPYAMGGEIFFEPLFDLYYLELESGNATRFAAVEDIFQPAFSPDGSLLAYVDIHSVHLRDMQTGETKPFDLLPQSGNGAGDAVISPDNTTIAWKESSGSNLMTMDYAPVIRVASISASIRHDLDEAFFVPSTGYDLSDLDTLAWLDGNRLLIATSGWNGEKDVWMLDVNGSTLLLLGEGEFTGFLYP